MAEGGFDFGGMEPAAPAEEAPAAGGFDFGAAAPAEEAPAAAAFDFGAAAPAEEASAPLEMSGLNPKLA